MAAAPDPGFSFANLGSPARLLPHDDAYELQYGDSTLRVRMADRLLVKARETVDAPSLRRLSPHVGNVQRLARLEAGRTNLWLLTLDGDMPAAIQALRQAPGVIYAQPDLLQVREPASTREADVSGGSPTITRPSPSGHPARVAIIDDGFDLNHPEFSGVNLLFQYDADQHSDDAGPKDAADRHGTRVAGLIFAAADGEGVDGLAPDAGLIAIRQVSSWTSDMVLAFSVARMMHADIVNASWTLAWLPEPLSDLILDWLGDRQPPYVVAAAGNRSEDACTGNALGRIAGVWLVGAHSADGQRLPYSNYGECVALTAPTHFTSTVPGQGYRAFGGTSAAAAHVSGLLARAIGRGERPDLDSMRVLLQSPMPQEQAR